jgi:cAMP-specific phosphodiesterase 4
VIWSSLIIEEFFLQGDNERANNSDISPFMDRHSENSAKVTRKRGSFPSRSHI